MLVKSQNYSEDFQKSVVSKYLNRGHQITESKAQDSGGSSDFHLWMD